MINGDSYDSFDINHPALNDLINTLVQHPVPIEPPVENSALPPRPLILTKKVFWFNIGTKKDETAKSIRSSKRKAR